MGGDAERREGRWLASAPRLVGPLSELLEHAFKLGCQSPVLLGFDFPTGLPRAYAKQTGFEDFLQALAAFGTGEWSASFNVADEVGQVSVRRPFYPRVSSKGVSRASLVQGLGVRSFDKLLRQCELKTCLLVSSITKGAVSALSAGASAGVTSPVQIDRLHHDRTVLFPLRVGDLPPRHA